MSNKKLQKPAFSSKQNDLPIEVLYPGQSAQYYSLSMPKPCAELEKFVDHYWIMRWELPKSRTFTAEVIPSPYMNLTFMKGGAKITGVTTGKYTYKIIGNGVIVGVKYLVGGFHGLTNQTASKYTDKVINAGEVFPEINTRLNNTILAADDKHAVAHMDKLLLKHLKKPSNNLLLVQSIVMDIERGSHLTVSSITTQYDITERRLQELFQIFVGVSPKWVILRYRLIKASRHALKVDRINWTKVALDLGYSDQSHFINDFKRIIGKPPGEYSKHNAK